MPTDASLTAAPRPLPAWLRFFRPAPPKPVTLTDPAELQRSLQAWQTRVLIASTIGYAIFYFVRKNLSVAMPVMEKQLGIGKESLGLFLTLHGVIYGVSKFTNGFFGDRCNARAFMVVGLAGSALMNLFFGFSSAVVTFGVFWMINGWFQGMGFPPCARLLAHWFPPKTFAMKMSVWNISHSAGAGQSWCCADSSSRRLAGGCASSFRPRSLSCAPLLCGSRFRTRRRQSDCRRSKALTRAIRRANRSRIFSRRS